MYLTSFIVLLSVSVYFQSTVLAFVVKFRITFYKKLVTKFVQSSGSSRPDLKFDLAPFFAVRSYWELQRMNYRFSL